MALNLEAAIKLSANVQDAAAVRSLSRDLNKLEGAAKISGGQLSRMKLDIDRMASAAGNTTTGLRQHVAALQALRDRAEIGGKAYNKLGIEIDQLKTKLRSLDGVATASSANLRQQLGSALAAAGAGRLAGGALQSSVASIESERRLRSLSAGLDDYTRVQQAATAASQRFGITQTQANQEFAQIYARLRPVGLTLEQVSTAYNGFNTAAKLSGTTSAEASAAFLQLSQALGTGVLRGEELNSVFEQTPGIVQAIAQVMGVPIGQIRNLAKEGRITSDIVLTALGKIEREGAPKLAEAMKGPAQQFRQLAIEGDRLQQQLGAAMLPVALQLTQATTGLLQEASKLPAPIKEVGAAAAATGIAVGSLGLAMNAIGGVSAATAALKAYTASATAAGTASAAAATQASGLAGILGTLGKVGVITIGVKFAVEGLDELLTGLVGVQDAENAARTMAERRGLTYTPSAAVQRRNRAASGYVSPFAGARDRAFDQARQIQPGQARPGAAPGRGAGGSAGGSGSAGGASGGGNTTAVQGRSRMNDLLAENLRLNTELGNVGKDRISQLNAQIDLIPQLLKLELADIDATMKGNEQAQARINAIQDARLQSVKLEEELRAVNREIDGITTEAVTLRAKTLGGTLPPKSPLQQELEQVRQELVVADGAAESLLTKLSGLAGTNPASGAARAALGKLRGDIATIDPNTVASQRLVQGDTDALRQQIAQLQNAGRALSTLDRLVIKYGEDWDLIDPRIRASLGALASQRDALQQVVDQTREWNAVLNQTGSTITDVFADLIIGTNDWRDSLRSALNSLSKLVLQTTISNLAGKDGVGFFSFLSGSLGAFANGGVMTDQGPLPLRSYSRGGVANTPQLALFGEGRLPEAYVPLPDGRRIPVAIEGAGGSQVVNNVTISVDAGNSDVKGDTPQAEQLGRAMAAAVQQELIRQKRPGGLLAN